MPVIPPYVFIIAGGIGFIWVSYELLTYYKPKSLGASEIAEKVRKKSTPDINRFAAGRQTTLAEKQTALDVQLNQRTVAALDLVEVPKRHERLVEVEKVSQENTVVVTKEATANRMSAVAYDEVRKTHEIEAHKTKLEIEKHRKMKEIDKEVYKFEKQLDTEIAIIVSIVPAFEMKKLTKQLEGELGELEYWMAVPESYQQKQMVTQLKKNIKLLKEAIDARGQGLLQGDNRKELRAMEED